MFDSPETNKLAGLLGVFVLVLGLAIRGWASALEGQCSQSTPLPESCPGLTIVGNDLSIAFLLAGSILAIWALWSRYGVRARFRAKAMQRG